jgi:hypothetical protein
MLQRDGSGPLVVTAVSANVACATGPPQRLTLSLRGGTTVEETGRFEYRGPADEASLPAWAEIHPTLILAGEVFDAATIEGRSGSRETSFPLPVSHIAMPGANRSHSSPAARARARSHRRPPSFPASGSAAPPSACVALPGSG